MHKIYPEVQLENTTFVVTIDGSDINPDKDRINNVIGYTNGNTHGHFDNFIDNAVSTLSNHIKVKSGYRVVDIKTSPDDKCGVYANGIFLTLDKIVAAQLRKASAAAIFLCTIGPEMENWSRKLLSEGESVYGYIANTVASQAVEDAADLLHDHIGQKMHTQGLNITNRYSPGYCNWPVTEQHLLFSLLPDNFCGVRLTESALMMPIKSISGIIGIGKKVKYTEYLCDRCNIKDCTYRTIRLERSGNQHQTAQKDKP